MIRRVLLAALAALAVLVAPAGAASTAERFDAAVSAILAEPYQPAYAPTGFDSAFPAPVPNTFPSQDYTTGSVPGNPDHPEWPASFAAVTFSSADGAPLFGRLALHPGRHPGVVVVHGFNTNAKESVIRWAAMLYANGYNVLAADQRSFRASYNANPQAALAQPQTFGWKESEDVLAAGRLLAGQAGVTSLGLVGFSLGGQDTVLALARDQEGIFDAGLNFSGPADQNTQIYSTAVPPGCSTPSCTYPATQALVILVVPPHDTGNPCTVLSRAATAYSSDPFSILAQENAFHRQTGVQVPLLNLYANDDPLVLPFQASMMAGYEGGNPLQRTLLLEQGAHAYFYDRWWQQRAVLLYFKTLLPGADTDSTIGTQATVNQTIGGTPAGTQLVDLGQPSRADADSQLAPFICDTSQGPPGGGGVADSGAKTTGGGWLADLAGKKINFSLQAEEKPAGFEGKLKLNDKPAEVKIELGTVTSLGPVRSPCGSVPAASNSLELRGTGTYNGAEGASFRVCVQDNGEGSNGAADLFYLACTAGCSYDTDARTPDDAIDGGNIQIRPSGQAVAAGGNSQARAATLTLDPLLATETVVGQVQEFEVAVYDQNQQPLTNAGVTFTRTTAGGTLSQTALTDTSGTAVILVFGVGEVAEYRATAGGVGSNAVELTPVAGSALGG